MNKLTKLLTFISPILVMGCNNMGNNNSNLTTGNLDTIHGNMLYFNNDTIELIGAGTSVSKLFEETEHQTNDAWDGIISLDHFNGEKVTALDIFSGRTGDVNTAKWLTARNYIVGYSNNPTPYFQGLPDNYNFAIRGNFMFKYKPNNTEYKCNNIAITQFNYNFRNAWGFFSNITPQFSASTTQLSSEKININCINKTTQQIEPFQVQADGSNNFAISKIESAPINILTDTLLKQQVANSFNSMPLNARISMYSNTFDVAQYKPRELVVRPMLSPSSLQLNKASDISIIQDGEPIIDTHSKSIVIGDGTVINCSNTSRDILSSSFHKQLSSKATMSTTHTLGGTLADLLPNGYGQLLLKIENQTTKAQFQYTLNSVTENNETSVYEARESLVTVAGYSKRYITAEINMIQYSGKFKFTQAVTGTEILYGFLFEPELKYLPVLLSNNTAGNINIFEAMNKDIAPLTPQIELNKLSQQVLLVGGGTYQGEMPGTEIHYNLSENIPLTNTEKAQCSANEESSEEAL